MYLAEAEEVFYYWQDHPPTYQMVDLIARMLGWEGPKTRENDGNPPEMNLALPPEMAAAIGRAAGVPAPIVSLDQMREKNRQKAIEIAKRNAAKRSSA